MKIETVGGHPASEMLLLVIDTGKIVLRQPVSHHVTVLSSEFRGARSRRATFNAIHVDGRHLFLCTSDSSLSDLSCRCTAMLFFGPKEENNAGVRPPPI